MTLSLSDSSHIAEYLARQIILIVDDDFDSRRLLGQFIKASSPDARILEAKGGEEAFETLEETIPDAIILDLNMQGESGLDVLKRLRELPRTRDIPVLVVTSFSSQLVELGMLDAGANDFLTKPVNHVRLVGRLVAMLVQAQRMTLLRDHVARYEKRYGPMPAGLIPDPDPESETAAAPRIESQTFASVFEAEMMRHPEIEIDPEARTVLIRGFREMVQTLFETFITRMKDNGTPRITHEEAASFLEELNG